jgi:hypothetical protein
MYEGRSAIDSFDNTTGRAKVTTLPRTVPLADAWEAGAFEWSQQPAENSHEQAIDEELTDGLKLIAKRSGIGYEPLVRRVLSSFATAKPEI